MDEKSEKVVLFNNVKDCCGCGACMSACPKNAIRMITDEYGFVYPEISDDICIQCRKCLNSCAYQNDLKLNIPLKSYAAVNKDEEQLKMSASGGVFSVLANNTINSGGTVFGATLYHDGENLIIEHIRIDDQKDIYKLQGSKYVHSDTSKIFKFVENDLKTGKPVLFTGTPCQVGALKGFLKKEYDNLLTVDIICHGVPSQKLFNDYIAFKENKHNIKINNYKFRYKNKGQGISSYIEFENNNKQCRYKVINGKEESYVFFFLKSYIYRENCYSCKYARNSRISDITIGDYWGFHAEHKDADHKLFSNSKGVSCLITNTEKGNVAIERVKDEYYLLDTSFKSVARHNAQLVSPSKLSSNRRIILDMYLNYGYKGVDDYFRKNFKKEIIIEKIKYITPKSLKRTIVKAISNNEAGLKR